MSDFLIVWFAVILALLLLHEMDAVKNAEWKLFAVLKRMDDAKAYRAFVLLHMPLYTALLLLLFFAPRYVAYYVVDIFLIAHAALHLLFEKHPQNGLKSSLSRSVIYMMGALAAIHLILFVAAAGGP